MSTCGNCGNTKPGAIIFTDKYRKCVSCGRPIDVWHRMPSKERCPLCHGWIEEVGGNFECKCESWA